MSNSSTSTGIERSRLATLGGETLRLGATALTGPLRILAFWSAIALPFLYVPLLIGGLEGGQATVFTGLLLLNALALVVGHGHRQ